jgi:DNA (cytosine-5)-methyltransferase 1
VRTQVIRVVELFAGIGACTQALKDEGIEHKVVAVSEWNIDSAIAYDYIHSDRRLIALPSKEEMREHLEQFTWSSDGKEPLENLKRIPLKKLEKLYVAQIRTNNLGSIIDLTYKLQHDPNYLPDFDLLTHGSPCQSFSVAGKGEGGDEGSETRSSLMWNTVEVVSIKKPIYILWENVKNVLSKKHRHNYDKYIQSLENLGHISDGKVLNAKDYGVPQNRERIFVASTLKEHHKKMRWPVPFDNGIRLKHLLETNVAEKYYISDEKCDKLLQQLKDDTVLIDMCQAKREGFPREYVENSPSLQARDYKEPRLVKVICNTNPSGNGMNGNVYAGGISPTVTTNKGEGHKIVVPIDYTYNDPQPIEIANCISARTDRGILNRKQEGTGVLECVPCLTPDRIEKRQNGRRFKEDGEPSFSLTTQDRHGVLVSEPCVLRAERTEYGKEIRKQYESGEIDEKIGNIRTLQPRFDGVSNTLTTVQKDNMLLEPLIESVENGGVVVKENNKKGYTVAYPGDSINLEQISSTTRRGRVGRGVAQTLNCGNHQAVVEPNECMMLGHIDVEGHDILKRVYDEKGISPTIPTCQGGNQEPKVYTRYRIRKLTPRECGRLMNFSDEAIDRIIESGASESAMYKMFGNSIVVMCPRLIFRSLFSTEEIEYEVGEQMSLI